MTTHLLNFITFQVWAVMILFGTVIAVITGNFVVMVIAAWLGLFTGILINEITPGPITNGIIIVSDNNKNKRRYDRR